ERIFERFVQGETGDRRRFGGGGIGLYIVRRLAGGQNGTVGGQSRPAGGTGKRLRLHRAPIWRRGQHSSHVHPKRTGLSCICCASSHCGCHDYPVNDGTAKGLVAVSMSVSYPTPMEIRLAKKALPRRRRACGGHSSLIVHSDGFCNRYTASRAPADGHL